jgi:hypothetical protein
MDGKTLGIIEFVGHENGQSEGLVGILGYQQKEFFQYFIHGWLELMFMLMLMFMLVL